MGKSGRERGGGDGRLGGGGTGGVAPCLSRIDVTVDGIGILFETILPTIGPVQVQEEVGRGEGKQ